MNVKIKQLILMLLIAAPAVATDDHTKTGYLQNAWNGFKCFVGLQATTALVRNPIVYGLGLGSLVSLSERLARLNPHDPSRFGWMIKAASFPFMLIHSTSAATVATRTMQAGAISYSAHNLVNAGQIESHRVIQA